MTTMPGAPLAVFAADCALVGLASSRGVVGGGARWLARPARGRARERRHEPCASEGADQIAAVVGACIGPECYEFGEGELARLEARYGPSVRSRTAAGRPALDLRAGVHRALEAEGVVVAHDAREAARRATRAFSPGVPRKDLGRHCLVVAAAP